MGPCVGHPGLREPVELPDRGPLPASEVTTFYGTWLIVSGSISS